MNKKKECIKRDLFNLTAVARSSWLSIVRKDMKETHHGMVERANESKREREKQRGETKQKKLSCIMWSFAIFLYK